MKPLMLRLMMVLALLAIPLACLADSKTIEAAQVAVRRAIRTKLGTGYRVAFEKATESFLSFSEVTITGDAHAVEGDDWRVDRTFSYSVKVKTDGSKTRDTKIEFKSGDDYRESGDWQTSHHEDEFVHLTSPSWYERFGTNRVTFEGEANDVVTIVVYNQEGRRVAETQVRPDKGYFRKWIDVPSGLLRATIKPRLAVDWEEVRFAVKDDSDNWGTPSRKPKPSGDAEDIVQTIEPKKNAVVTNSRVTIAGNCSERSVRVQIWDSRNNRVTDRNVPTRNGYWNTQIELSDGRYKVSAESDSRRDKDEWNFTVSTNNDKPASASTPFKVLEPTNDSTLRSSRVTIAGNSTERYVRVQIWDSRNKQIADRNVPTKNGYWNTQIELADGSYRAAAETASGRDRRGFRFIVKKKK